jgi:methionyl-tRNA synthetase
MSSFGNFVNRALKFVASQYDGVIPDTGDLPGPFSQGDPVDGDFFSSVNNLLQDYINAMDAVKLRLGLQTVMLISIRGNNYLQSSGLNKALLAQNPARCAQVVSRTVNLIYVLSALVYPFMPATSESMLTQLNAPARAVPDVLANDILAGHTLGKPDHLFKRIDEKMVEVWRAKFGGNENAQKVPIADGQAARNAHAVATVNAAPKSAEYLALESKIAEQGQIVRALKAQTPRSEEQITIAVVELKRLKGELAGLRGT